MAWPTRTAIASLACLAAACSQAASADFDGYEMMPVDQLPVTRAASLMTIVAGLIDSPEEPIGSPFLALEITGDGAGFVVDAELRGYLDDSILGENLKARIEPDGTQWRLIAVGRQTICARGEAAGKPALLCP